MPEQSVLREEKPYFKDYFSGTFNGECNLDGLAESHFRDFELYYEAYGASLYSDISILFRRTISGKVKFWFDRTDFTSAQTLKSEFLKTFGKQKPQQYYVKILYNSKLGEGEDINSYIHKLKEAGAALGVTNENKIKDNFLRGLPSHLFALVAGNRDKSLTQIVELTSRHLDYFRESKGAVEFDLTDKVNSTEKTSAKTLLQEESGLVRQVRELSQELRGLKSQLGTRGASEEPPSDFDCPPEGGIDNLRAAESRGRPLHRSHHQNPYRRSDSPSRDRFPNRDRYPSRERYPNKTRYPSRDRYYTYRSPSMERFPSVNRFPNRDRYSSRETYTNRERYPSGDRYYSPGGYSRDTGRDSYDPYSRDYPRYGSMNGPPFGYSQGEGLSNDFGQSRQGSFPRQPRQIRCDRCGGIGHIARRCASQIFNQDFQ